MCFSSKMRSVEDRPDLVWKLYLRCINLWPSPLVVNVILEVPMTDELLNFILRRDTFFRGVTNNLMVSIIFVQIPLGTVSTQWVRSFEHSSLFRYHKDVLSRRDQVNVVGKLVGRRSWHSQI